MNTKIEKAFTLIELLVVISIIALLMSVMMPALGKARESAKIVVCKSNLKNIGLAAKLWSEDNDGWSVPCTWAGSANPEKGEGGSFRQDRTWKNYNPGSLEPYTSSGEMEQKKLYTCPSAKSVKFYDYANWGIPNYNKTRTYGVNGFMTINTYVNETNDFQSPGDKGITKDCPVNAIWGPDPEGGIYYYKHGITKIDKIRRPDITVYFLDFEQPVMTSWNFDPILTPEEVEAQGGQPTETRWHSKKSGQRWGFANMVWVDGHVSKEPDDLADEQEQSRLPRWHYYFWNH